MIPAALLLGGCVGELAHHSDPYFAAAPKSSLILDADQFAALQSSEGNLATLDSAGRNRFVSLKMYAIDQAYFDYERRLTNEDVAANSLGTIGTLASTTVAAAIPAGQATKALAAVAAGLTGATSIYDDKVLLSKTIQALQIQMRTDRDTVATRIYSRRSCVIDAYDVGMALSDLEAYARAGTLESALQNLTNTVGRAHDDAAATKQAAAEGGAGAAKLAATEVDANAAAKAADAAMPACPLQSPAFSSRM